MLIADNFPLRARWTASLHCPELAAADFGGRRISPLSARIIGGLSGLLTLIQFRDGPERYGALSRLETMPSRPILHVNAAPSSSVCSLRTMPKHADG
jgi:hypothetical protein